MSDSVPLEPAQIAAADLVAVDVLDDAGVEYRLHTHAQVMRAEDYPNIGFALEQSAKTLAFAAADQPVLVCLPAVAKLAYGQLAKSLEVSRSQLKPAPPELLAELGMRPGGVCPFATAPNAKVVIDEAVLGFSVIYCGAGDPHATIELTAGQLRRACPEAMIADVTPAP